jgi:competence protein ComEC
MGAIHMSADAQGINEGITPVLAGRGAEVSVWGRAVSSPLSAGSRSWFYLEVNRLECCDTTYECRERLLTTADSSSFEGVFPGVRLRAWGSLEPDDGGKLWDRGASAYLNVKPRSADVVSRTVELARSGFSRSYRRMYSRSVAGMMEGVTLSKLDGIDSGVLEDLEACGLSHIVAVSGLNVSSLAAAVLVLGSLLGVGRRGRYLAACSAGVAILALADFRPSASRACVMGALASAGELRGRKYDAWAGLSIAGMLILVLNPRALFDGGFQLSFAATSGILLAVKKSRRASAGHAMLAVCAGAQIGVLPVILLKGEGVPLTALAANLLAVPVVGVLLVTAWISAVLYMAYKPVGSALGIVPDLCVKYIMRVASALGRVPTAAAGGPRWQVAALCLYAFALFVFVTAEEPRRTIRAAAFVLLAVVSVLAPGLPVMGPSSQDRVMVIDVGQGDAILVQDRTGACVLVDGGPDPELIVRKLSAMGVKKLDVVVATHPHSDHVAGLLGVVERFPIGMVLDTDVNGEGCEPHHRLLGETRSRGIERVVGREGLFLKVSGEIELEVLYPPVGLDTSRLEPNECSMVVMAKVSGGRVLLCGDLEAEGQKTLTSFHPDLECEVLKVPHQGARDAVSDELLSAARPALAVISVGRGNEYGHPSRRCLELMSAKGIPVARTDRDGDIEIEVVSGRIALVEHRR